MIDPVTGIWSLKEAYSSHFFDEPLANAIVENFGPPARMADLGCGLGDYCAVFSKAGWSNVIGFEGTPGIKEIAHYSPIVQRDLSIPGIMQEKFDFVLSLEVGEHIPREREQAFLDNATKCCTNILVLSWAIPHQGGWGHVNERPNEYVIKQIEQRGFVYCAGQAQLLRDVSTQPWYKNTLLTFLRIRKP